MKISHIDSVSVLFIFKGKIFFVQRQTFLKDFPGYLAFPGGKIDTNESSIPFETKFLSENDSTIMRALSREIYEELGYDLEEGIKNSEVLSISELADVLAPEFAQTRFKTWFYRIDLNKKIDFCLDLEEFTNGFWEYPHSLLENFRKGNILMVPPTRRILEKLKKFPKAKQFGNLNDNFNNNDYVPCLEMLEGIKIFPVRSSTLPPANRTNALLLGDKNAPKLLVDPSPNSKKEYHKLRKTIDEIKIDSIFLTHHHPDHHQFANELARKMSIPILLSNDTRERIVKKYGPDYFEKIKLHNPTENEELTRWHGTPVRIYKIPGHDAGHLGLAPDSMKWFLVGDLIQGVGTVVIPPNEGDMQSYFSTLEKVIALNPEVIIPSHGIPMRSTHRLKETLKHRIDRESQILNLYNSGKSKKEILDELYFGINPRLKELAIQNIESHLLKLDKEKKLLV